MPATFRGVQVSISATWQVMPSKYLAPVMDGVLMLHEAAELWDLFLMHPDEWIEPPKHLRPAIDRLTLWQAPAMPTKH